MVIGVAAIFGGLLIAACALLILLQALVIALAHYMPDWMAALVVGVVVAIIAFVAIWQGRRNLSMGSSRHDAPFVPFRTPLRW